jgi:hypothetical protein
VGEGPRMVGETSWTWGRQCCLAGDDDDIPCMLFFGVTTDIVILPFFRVRLGGVVLFHTFLFLYFFLLPCSDDN